MRSTCFSGFRLVPVTCAAVLIGSPMTGQVTNNPAPAGPLTVSESDPGFRELGLRTRTPMGIELKPAGSSEKVRSVEIGTRDSLGDAIERLTQVFQQYDTMMADGVINIAPPDWLHQPQALLNRRLSSFVGGQLTVRSTLVMIRAALDPAFKGRDVVFTTKEPDHAKRLELFLNRRVEIDNTNASMRRVLNGIAVAVPEFVWLAEYKDNVVGPANLEITIQLFSGGILKLPPR